MARSLRPFAAVFAAFCIPPGRQKRACGRTGDEGRGYCKDEDSACDFSQTLSYTGERSRSHHTFHAFIQSQLGLHSQNANRMLTLFRKICFGGKKSQSLAPTRKTPEIPVKSIVSGVLKGAEKRSKCSKRHPLPRTRNQVVRKGTWVRIPPSPPLENTIDS